MTPGKSIPKRTTAFAWTGFRCNSIRRTRGSSRAGTNRPTGTIAGRPVTPKPVVDQIGDLPSLSGLPFTFNSGGPGKTAGAGIEFPLVCWFRTAFSADVVPSKLSLVMDRSAILGDYQIYLNGVRLPGKAFRPTFRYDHNNVTCAVVRRATTGRNVLAIRVELDDLNQGLVDAFYVFGKFGVRRWLNHYLRMVAPGRPWFSG